MHIGMLWFDKDPNTTLDQKVEAAAIYYRNKYGIAATLCYVHPSMMPHIEGSEKASAAGVELRANRSVLINHFWIGQAAQ